MSRLMRAAGVRPGEERILALVAMLFGALEAGRGFGEVGLDTLVVSRFGTGTLPYLYIGLGATSLVAALAYGAALGRVSRTPLLAGILLGSAALLAAGRLIVAGGMDGIVPFIWLVTYAAGCHRRHDRVDRRRVRLRCSPGEAALPAVHRRRHRRQLRRDAGGSGPVARAAGTELLMVIEAVLLARGRPS